MSARFDIFCHFPPHLIYVNALPSKCRCYNLCSFVHRDSTVAVMQDTTSAKDIEKKLASLSSELQKLKVESENDEKELKLAQQHLQEINAGLSKNEDGAYTSLNDQLMGESYQLESFCVQYNSSSVSKVRDSVCIEHVCRMTTRPGNREMSGNFTELSRKCQGFRSWKKFCQGKLPKKVLENCVSMLFGIIHLVLYANYFMLFVAEFCLPVLVVVYSIYICFLVSTRVRLL